MATTEEEMTRDLLMKFSGPALETGRMPVRDLAPSLLALGELFQRVQAINDPMAPPVALEAKAFESGSFEVGLFLSTQDVMTLLSSPPAMAIGNLIGIVCNSGEGLFALIKWLRGRIVVSRDEPEPGSMQVKDNHGNVFMAKKMVFNSYDDLGVRELANKVVEPLRKPGVHELEIQQTAANDVVTVADEEAEAFEACASKSQSRKK